MITTIKDVAAHCQLSRETVNQILCGRGARYRPATRERVLSAAAELGYRPNSAARAMRHGRFHTIGLISASEAGRGTLDADLLYGIQLAASDDLHLAIGQVGDDEFTSPDGLPRIVGEWSCDGLLLNHVATFPAAARDLLERSGIPAVWLNVRHASDCIHPDDRGAATAAVRRLAALGHRRIAWFSTTGGQHYSRADRRDGYASTMRAAGLEPAFHDRTVDGASEALGAAAQAMLATGPTAVVCYSASDAIPAAFAAARLGLVIPRDLSLVCLGPASANVLGIDLTHARPDFTAMGRKAVELLRQRIVAPTASIPTCVHPFVWREGGTITAPSTR